MRILSLLLLPSMLLAEPASRLEWSTLPELPPGRRASKQIGVAGPFVGVHKDVLIVAGGANFPDGKPWDKNLTGQAPPKVYHDDVYAMRRGGTWERQLLKLPQAAGYGVAVDTPRGVLCMGGEWKVGTSSGQALRRSNEVLLLVWHNGKVYLGKDYNGHALPKLPKPVTMQAGALIGNTVYLAGGDTVDGPSTLFWSMELLPKGGDLDLEWKAREPWPGPPRVLAVSAVQSDGVEDRFYLFSGRNPQEAGIDYLSDGYSYSPKEGLWKKLSGVVVDGQPRCIMAGTAAAAGAYGILAFGGADGEIMRRLIDLETREKAAAGEEKARLESERKGILNQHPGFSKDLLAYHTVTDTWHRFGELPRSSPVTTRVLRWGEQYVIPSGEISPGIRSAGVLAADIVRESSFGGLNMGVLIVYLLLILVNGLYFARRMKNTEDFFKAGKRIPWWAAGLSIFGTQLSAITFMTIPAKTFATDWRMFIAQVTILAVAPLIIFFFLPFYRKLDITTAYEYLEMRFNVFARVLGSMLFILLQFGRIAIVLLLPALALSTVTGMSENTCILLMGLLCVLYTTLGGMEAVIWTDVVQVVILLGGALLALCLMPMGIEGGFGAMREVAADAGKFTWLDLRMGLSDSTFFVLLFAGVGLNLISYGSDQAVIQRYLTTPDEKSAARSIWTNGLLAIPASAMFFLIGSMLFAFYKLNPAAMDPLMAKPDALFPMFMVTHLPVGIAGLVIAAVFAASMSSLDSSMNSVSAAVTTDFYRRFKKHPNEKAALLLARFVVVVVGCLGTGFALWMAHSDVKSLWDEFSKYIGLFGGGLGGLFILGIFTRRTSGKGAVLGLLASVGFQYWLKVESDIALHPWLYAVSGMLSCILVGYLSSFVLKNHKRDSSLTIYKSRRHRRREA